MNTPPPSTGKKGNTLLFVLWIIAFLSALVLTMSFKISSDLINETRGNDLRMATSIAQRGIVVGSHALARNGDPVLAQQFGPRQRFVARKSKAGARANPNFLINNHPEILEQIFVRWGAPRPEAQDAVEALVDWVDPDDQLKKGGSERLYYTQKGAIDHPYNRKFLDIQEMLLVEEFQLMTTYYPNWSRHFSFFSAGPLDLEYASADTISALTGVPIEFTESFVEQRNGPDGITGSPDDAELTDIDYCLNLLTINETDQSIYRNFLTLGTSVETVVSRGEFNGIAVEIELTFRYHSGGIERLGKTTKRVGNENGKQNTELLPN